MFSQVVHLIFVQVNCSADTASVIFPIRLLWRVKLPGRQRRMLLSLFTTSRFLCGFALAHSISQLVGKLPVQVILAEIQVRFHPLTLVPSVIQVFLDGSIPDHLQLARRHHLLLPNAPEFLPKRALNRSLNGSLRRRLHHAGF